MRRPYMFVVCFIAAGAVSAFTAVREPLATASANVVGSSQNPACLSAALNGILEIGCWGYKECINDVVYEHRCPDGEVFERDSMKCVPSGTGNTDCNKVAECPNKEDVMYPDLGDLCQTYHRCFNGINIGRFYCPASLVFSFDEQLCNYRSDVKPPCGTKSIVG